MSTDTTTKPPGPHEIALLRAGPRAAVTVAVVALHLRGAVGAGRRGTLRRTPGGAAGAFRHPLEKAVRSALYRPAGLRELPGRLMVARALARMRAEAVAAGLSRSVPPRRTRAWRRRLAELRAAHPLPGGPEGLGEDEIVLAVALYGEPALAALVPRFAREAGLTGRGALADAGRFPFGRSDDLRLLSGGESYDGTDGDRGYGGHGGHDHASGGGFGCGGGGGGFD
ncbi:TIGR04222 domain-containing membrane protein [Streptomyces griseosporeus]